jgi:L-lactate dehydrogenase complex protein LldG
MGTSDRQRILSRIRQVRQPSVELPSLDQSWIKYDNPIEQFMNVVQAVGGSSHVVDDPCEARERLDLMPTYTSASTVFSQIPKIAESTIHIDEIADPHDLAQLDYGIFQGEFGVAENAAIWLTDERVSHRVLFFIAQHLVIVVPDDQILHNMHEAYQRLSFAGRSFGVFMSGPSKTADIEQSLVIGAHGARSLTVLLMRSTTNHQTPE